MIKVRNGRPEQGGGSVLQKSFSKNSNHVIYLQILWAICKFDVKSIGECFRGSSAPKDKYDQWERRSKSG